MLKSIFYKLTKHFGNVGSTLIAVALVAIIIEEVRLFQSISLLVIGIMTIIITSWYLSKEENND